MCEVAVHLLAGQKRLEYGYKEPDLLHKVEANMAGMKEAIKQYFRLHHDVMRAPLACVIMKTIIVKTYVDYPKCDF